MAKSDKRNMQRGERDEDHYHGKYPDNSQYGLRNSDDDGRGKDDDHATRTGVPDKELPAEGLARNEADPTPTKPGKDGS
jgi:hypothetical protein